jgi:hypothetical protein
MAEAVLPVVATLLGLMGSSRLLNALPEVRKRALMETLRAAQTEENVVQILLDNVSTSPFIPQEQKDTLAEMVLMQQWDQLGAALQCEAPLVGPPQSEPPVWNAFVAYRDMVVSVFSTSRKMQLLDEALRRNLGAEIHSQMSVDALRQLAVTALSMSTAFDEDARTRVANDIFDDRYDFLLLEDRFDCEEEVSRINCSRRVADVAEGSGERPDVVEEECPVCLGANVIDTRLPCRHQFCSVCLEEWAARAGAAQGARCPMCRAPFDAAQLSPSDELLPSYRIS